MSHGAFYNRHAKYAWQRQPDAVLNQANPGSGVSYPVLALSGDVRIYSIAAWVTWTVQPNPLEVLVTIDGQVINHNVANPVSATAYEAVTVANVIPTWQVLIIVNPGQYRAFLHEGQSVGVAARTTGGTVQNLSCVVKWARLLPT